MKFKMNFNEHRPRGFYVVYIPNPPFFYCSLLGRFRCFVNKSMNITSNSIYENAITIEVCNERSELELQYVYACLAINVKLIAINYTWKFLAVYGKSYTTCML